MTITHAQYHLYATLFDALLAVDVGDPGSSTSMGTTLRGQTAGAALRCWGAGRDLEVAAETMGTDVGRQHMSWTVLSVPFGAGDVAITVILDDYIYTPLAEVADLALAQPAIEQEIAF